MVKVNGSRVGKWLMQLIKPETGVIISQIISKFNLDLGTGVLLV